MVRVRAGRPSAGAVVAVWLPVLAFAVLAWQHRWVADDGFINLRILWNIEHGHGPVYNAGERVEAGTSPLWILVMLVARVPFFFLDPAWSTVLVGIALAVAGLAFASLGARAWWASTGHDAVLPLGAGLILALPPMWDFASAGLELGLAFAWIGVCWWAIARRLGEPNLRIDRPWWVPVLVGLGPLVRPDMVVFTVAFAVALAVTSLPGWRAELRALALALALPGLYQVFRMGYYGLLVPKTALAKESGRVLWGRGWTYLDIYLGSTLLVVPLLLLTMLWLTLWPRGEAGRRHAVVAAAPVVAGLIHGLYVVRVGGDFMYARLFLPATFALICPVAALPVPRDRRLLWGPIGILTAVLLYVGVAKRWDPTHITDNPDTPNVDGDLSIDGVANERLVYGLLAGNDNPVTYDDYEPYVNGPLAELEPLPRDDTLVDLGGSGREARADRPIVVAGSIGLVGYRFLGVTLVDQLSLADPLGAHLEAGPPSRPGHEKIMAWEWVLARFAKPSLSQPPTTDDARLALRCGDLKELIDAVDAPLTPGRFLRNLVGSPARTQLRVPPLPVTAEQEFC